MSEEEWRQGEAEPDMEQELLCMPFKTSLNNNDHLSFGSFALPEYLKLYFLLFSSKKSGKKMDRSGNNGFFKTLCL